MATETDGKYLVIESYAIETDGLKVEINIIHDPKEFVNLYHLNFPSYGAGTSALLTNLKKSLVAEIVSRTGQLDMAAVEKIRGKFVEKAQKILDIELPSEAEETKKALIGILMHEMLGLGRIEFLLSDGDLEEIVINKSQEPLWVYHKKYGWLKTNVKIETEAEIENYANIIARRVGKQITILAPLLDAHLITGDRANATLFPISSKGNTVTIRRFRRDPWTVTDFIKTKTASAELMALIWEAIEYELNILISGGTASGKTSFLNVCMPFIQPNHRVLSIEDSVAGESEIIIKQNNKIQKTTIGELIDALIEDDSIKDTALENDEEIEIISMPPLGKIDWKKPSHFIRHWVKKDILEITLKSGRQIKVTPDHSLFALNENGKIETILGKKITKKSFLATPRCLEWQGEKIIFNLKEHLEAFKGCFIKSLEIAPLIEKNRELLCKNYQKQLINKSIRKNFASTAMIELINEKPETGWISSKLGTKIPMQIEIDETWARFAGLWLADGCYDKNSVLVSIVEPEARATVEAIAERFGLKTKMHSDGITLMINSKPFKQFLENVLELKGNAYTKKIPGWAFRLETPIAAALLNGYFSGDGWVRKNDIAIVSASRQLLQDTQTMLLRFGIPLRIKWKMRKDKTFEARISGTKFLKQFAVEIGFCIDKKTVASEKWLTQNSHDVSDIIPIPKKYYKEIKKAIKQEVGKTRTYKSWKSYGHNNSNIGRRTLQKLVEKYEEELPAELKELASNGIFWDQVEEIEQKEFEGFVYDLSVPENESFVANNIICHNTRELMLPDFLHWVPLTTREPNPEGKGGITMLDLLINSLRMRPDRVIVGEVRRQSEAEVMFEAMHTGHSVYTTIHANTADETITRLVNPPVSIPISMLDSVHLNIVMFRNRRLGSRRVLEAAEFIPEKRGKELEIKPNIIYRWRSSDDKIVAHNESIRFYDELSLHTGLSQNEIQQELKTKTSILNWMVAYDIHNVNSVGKIMAQCYQDIDEIKKLVEKNKKPEL
jgi:Flp pilus assembly CpaF family ATPase